MRIKNVPQWVKTAERKRDNNDDSGPMNILAYETSPVERCTLQNNTKRVMEDGKCLFTIDSLSYQSDGID